MVTCSSASLAGVRDDDDVRESASGGEGFEHFQQ
jgi:hypothetical protein